MVEFYIDYMKKKGLFVFVVTLVGITLYSCSNGGEESVCPVEENVMDCEYVNPIDSIIHTTQAEECFSVAYGYLKDNPDFVETSEDIGYYRFEFDGPETAIIWKDLDEIRVYSIPEESNYTTYCHNIVQIRKDNEVVLDTTFLKDNFGWMKDLIEVNGRNGKLYYILNTDMYVSHQGEIYTESITAFSVENGRLVKENLFHAKDKQYDIIEVSCGGQRSCPLRYDDLKLISMDHVDDSDYSPTIIVALVNQKGWPTGYGLKYKWNGEWFEYDRRCEYDCEW